MPSRAFCDRCLSGTVVVPDRRQWLAGGNLHSDSLHSVPVKSFDTKINKIHNDPVDQNSVRNPSNLVIREGFKPPLRLELIVEGKGKGLLEVRNDVVTSKPDSSGILAKDSSSTSGLVLKVNMFTGILETDVQNQVNKNLSATFVKDIDIAETLV